MTNNAHVPEELDDVAYVFERLVLEDMSHAELAEETGVSSTTIGRRAEELRIPTGAAKRRLREYLVDERGIDPDVRASVVDGEATIEEDEETALVPIDEELDELEAELEADAEDEPPTGLDALFDGPDVEVEESRSYSGLPGRNAHKINQLEEDVETLAAELDRMQLDQDVDRTQRLEDIGDLEQRLEELEETVETLGDLGSIEHALEIEQRRNADLEDRLDNLEKRLRPLFSVSEGGRSA